MEWTGISHHLLVETWDGKEWNGIDWNLKSFIRRNMEWKGVE